MKKNILLVDDEETLRWALQEALAEEGYEIDSMDDGLKALEQAKKTTYDLLISDYKMPTISGLQLIAEIKKIQPNIKAIIMTAYGSVETVIEAMHVGVADFVTKPFKIEHMKRIINGILNASLTQQNNYTVSSSNNGGEEELFYDNLFKEKALFFVAKNVTGTDVRIFYDAIETEKVKLFLFGSALETTSVRNLDAMIKTIFRTLTTEDISPDNLIREINLHLCKNVYKRFPVSLSCSALDKQKQTFSYAIHGQDLIGFISQSNGEVKKLESSPLALNMFPGIRIVENVVSVLPDSKFVLIHSNALLKCLRNGAIAVDDLNKLVSDSYSIRCEDMANGIKFRMGEFTAELATEGKDSVVIVSTFENRPVTSWEEMTPITMPIENFEKLLIQIDSKLSLVVKDGFNRYAIVASIIEAIMNASTFAYDHREKKDVCVKFARLGEEVIVEVNDHGCGFDVQGYKEPDTVSYNELTKKSGRGIFLMRRLMDRVMIQSSKEMGTAVYMAKKVACNDN